MYGRKRSVFHLFEKKRNCNNIISGLNGLFQEYLFEHVYDLDIVEESKENTQVNIVIKKTKVTYKMCDIDSIRQSFGLEIAQCEFVTY